jgi:Arc/MetJ-type ribon-helix-helix transcriptional regulator
MDTEKVVVRLTPDAVAVLETLVESGDYSNLSEVVMAAISDFISEKFLPEQIGEILERHSENTVLAPSDIMEAGDSAELNDQIKDAVKNYIRNRMG